MGILKGFGAEFKAHHRVEQAEKEVFPRSPLMEVVGKWCEQDKMRPKVVGRQEWEEIAEKGRVLQEKKENKAGHFAKVELVVPKNMQAWEMPLLTKQVLEAVKEMDKKRGERKLEDLRKAGEWMLNLSLYIEKFSGDIADEEKAEEILGIKDVFCGELKKMAEGFLRASGKEEKEDEEKKELLTEDEVDEVEKQLAQMGFEDSYNKLKATKDAGGKVDERRRRKVMQFFRIQQKSFEYAQTEDYGKFQQTRSLINRVKSWPGRLKDEMAEVFFGGRKGKIPLTDEEKFAWREYKEKEVVKKQWYELDDVEKKQRQEEERRFYGQFLREEGKGEDKEAKETKLPWRLRKAEDVYFEYNRKAIMMTLKEGSKELIKAIGIYNEERLEEALGVDLSDEARETVSLFIDDKQKEKREELIKSIKELDMAGKKKELGELRKQLEEGELSEDEKAKVRKALGEKELEFARAIQDAVGNIDYQGGSDAPADIWDKQERNCVGASLFGGTLLKDLGIKYIQCGTPSHSFIMVATTNDELRLNDMGTKWGGYYNQKIEDKDIKAAQGQKGKVDVERLLAIARRESDEVVDFDVLGKDILKINKHTFQRRKRNNTVSAYPAEEGLLAHRLLWVKNDLKGQAKKEAFELILSTGSKHERSIVFLGQLLEARGKEKMAEIYYKKAVRIEPDGPNGYLALGEFYKRKKRQGEAKACFLKVLEAGDEEMDSYAVGWARYYLNLKKEKKLEEKEKE